MSEVKWEEAPSSVIRIAEELIEKHHPWLQSAKIVFVMRSEAQKTAGRYVISNTAKIPAKLQPVLDGDFLIWLSQQDYDQMSSAQREAAIDHELCHIKLGGDGLTLRRPDIIEFSEIVERHGLWSRDLRRLDDAKEKYQQASLPIPDTKITMSTPSGRVATVTGEQFDRLTKMSPRELGELAREGAGHVRK
ncbi:MAG TPA: putative metallopeptidase [Anaerolineaceae bacterium]|nr:putative metallopeptidase [Anaerolineaceae bacterium]